MADWTTQLDAPARITIDDVPHIGIPYDPPAKDINLTPDDPQWVCIVSRSLHWDLYCMLGQGAVVPERGIANFDTVTVPQRKTILDYSGHDLWGLTLPLMFDAWEDELAPPKAERRKRPPKFADVDKRKRRRKLREQWRRYRDRHNPQTVQQYIDLIVQLTQPRSRRRPPHPVRIYGKAIANHLNGEAWQITGLDWGGYLHTKDGRIRRQALTLTLSEPNPGDEFTLKQRKQKHKDNGGGNDGGHVEKYRVKQGDTLQEIAAKFYGDPHKWERIARANNIKNPRKLHDYIGEKIIIP